MNREQFQTWIDTLGRAWETRDAQSAADLFTEEATYQENPFDEPMRGRAAIFNYWAALPREQQDIRVKIEIVDLSTTTGIARWTANFTRVPSGQRAHLEGVFVASFKDGERRAHAFREWWQAREDRANRPVALITGASRGLGETLAGFLAGQGYDLILTARGAEALAKTAESLQRYQTTVIPLPGDVSDPAHRARLIEAAQKFGRLDVLVNNASTLGPSPLLSVADYPLDELADVFKTNVIAPVGLIQSALPLLKTSGGLIINISSDAGVGGYETWGGYGSSKAALDLLSLTLANEQRPAGIAVVSVDPGDMRTVMHQQAFPGDDISDRPLPEVTLPFWAWLLGQDRMVISGQRFKAQAEQWEVMA